MTPHRAQMTLMILLTITIPVVLPVLAARAALLVPVVHQVPAAHRVSEVLHDLAVLVVLAGLAKAVAGSVVCKKRTQSASYFVSKF